MKLHLAREGIPFVFGLGALALALDLLGWWWAGLVTLGMTLFVAGFFRDPDREAPAGNVVVSPADGRIVAIAEALAPESTSGEKFQRVSIFMSPLDVHVNRVPASGEIVSVRHTAGKFLAAFSDRASAENERNEVAMRDDQGRSIVFVQIAGWLARRIVCHLRPGQRVEQGSRYGLIMFGSRVDVYLPPSVEVKVRLGDRVRAGSGSLGEYRS